MDAGMLEMDALAAFRQIPEFAPLARVTTFTAYGMESVVVQALALGAVDFIVKPFARSRLVAGVDRMLVGTSRAQEIQPALS